MRAVILVIASALTLSLAWPWGDYTGHTHWNKIGWIPFVSTPVRPLDILANLLLFAPLGVAAAAAFRRRPVLAAALVALVLSIGIELVQVFSHTRFPSATDVACNVIGAILAAHATAGRKQTG